MDKETLRQYLKENPSRSPEIIPAVNNNLLRQEYVRYLMGWKENLGDQKKVIYNAMGPDISSVLFLTNPETIIGIDPRGFWGGHSLDYVTHYWSLIDKEPIMRAGAFGYRWTNVDKQSYEETRITSFFDDISLRKIRGHWDIGSINRWDLDRLFMIELKKLGVKPETIEITTKRKVSKIGFDWAYPREIAKRRSIEYYGLDLDEIKNKRTSKIFKGTTFFYQKGLPYHKLTVGYLKYIKRFLENSAIVAVGYRFKPYSNDEYREEMQNALGNKFRQLTPNSDLDPIIDTLPPLDDDCVFEENKYGMKLHVFKRS